MYIPNKRMILKCADQLVLGRVIFHSILSVVDSTCGPGFYTMNIIVTLLCSCDICGWADLNNFVYHTIRNESLLVVSYFLLYYQNKNGFCRWLLAAGIVHCKFGDASACV